MPLSCAAGLVAVAGACLRIATPIIEWDDADWAQAKLAIIGPARNGSHVLSDPSVSLMRRLDSLAPLLQKVAVEESQRPLARACHGASDFTRCVVGLLTLRSLAKAHGRYPQAKAFDDHDQAALQSLLVENTATWVMPSRHWTEGGPSWIALTAYALGLELYNEAGQAEVRAECSKQPARGAGSSSASWTFGENWLEMVEEQIAGATERQAAMESAQNHLLGFLGRSNLSNLTFLDVGCGAGLNSWAALAAGARRVLCVDLDPASRETARRIRASAAKSSAFMRQRVSRWTIHKVNLSDDQSFARFHGKVDVVYCHGVAHHTPDPWRSIRNLMRFVAPQRGALYLAIYGYESVGGRKGAELEQHRVLRYRGAKEDTRRVFELEAVYSLFATILMLGHDIRDYVEKHHALQRGTNVWSDIKDRLGGWPVHFLSARAVVDFVHDQQVGLEVLSLRNFGQTEFLIWSPSEDSVVAEAAAAMACEELDPRSWRGAIHPHSGRPGYSYHGVSQQWLNDYADTIEAPTHSRRVLLRENGRIFGHPLATSPVKHILEAGGVVGAGTTAYGISANQGLVIFYSMAPERVRERYHGPPNPSRSRFEVCLLPADEL